MSRLPKLLVAVAILVTLGPALLAPWRWFVGEPHVDAYGTQWFFWFSGEVLAGRQSAAHTDLLFFPWGKDVYLHTGGNLLDAWLAWPLRVVLGPSFGYDVWVALVLAGNAWAGVVMARALGAEARLAWTAAFALVLNPYVLVEISFGRPTQALMLFPGLCVALLWTLRTPAQALGCGLLMAATACTYWFHGLVLAGLAVLYGVWRVAVGPDRVRTAALLVLAASVCLATVLPVAWPLLHAVSEGQVPGLLTMEGTGPLAPLALRTMEGDAEGMFVLALLRGAAGSLLDEGGLRFNPGIPVLLAVQAPILLLGLWRARRTWMVVWLLAAVIVASGPAFIYGDDFVVNRAYLWALEHLPFLRRWWWPGRAVFAIHLVLAALVPFALAAVPSRLRPWLGGALLVGAVAQLRGDALFPLQRWDGQGSPVLACLEAAPEGAVIDVPWAKDQLHLWYQTLHRKPILSGMLSKKTAFGPPEVVALREENTLVQVLVGLGEGQYTRSLSFDAADRQELLDLGYRYVLARASAFERPRPQRDGSVKWEPEWSRPRRLLEKAIGEAPVAEDERFALWTLDGSGLSCP